ncbi:hypothetical protein F1559_004983 [Cyanidiococcus yangmingshanensis]|uniref:Uncharacterized protein n=1 Tax=Cyanidiococcus yangmingshanensis TaxID=2690220 RepID=A0A7J7IPJ7_9RHOD|nr:hypothetical protein F1559_004983 [Cyanidiococcus yangmingshanensis]
MPGNRGAGLERVGESGLLTTATMREEATRRRAEPLQLLAETHHAQSLEMNGSPEKRAGSGPQQLGVDASAAERAFRSGRQYPAAVYADVEMWLDRELFEALDEVRDELSERSISRPFDEHRTGSMETNLARTWPIRPYPDLDELHHEKTERLSKAASAANIPTIDSQAAMKGLTRTKIEALRSDEIEPQRAATKRRRATVSVLSCDELNIYLKAALDELEREIDSAEVGESYVEDAPPRSRTPSIPTKKASRRVASLEQEENARGIAHSQTDTIGQALHRIYAELRQRVLAHKYETVEAFVADLSLLLSDLSRSKTDHASTRTGIRQRTDLIRQRVDALLQPAEITRVLRTRPGAPGVSSPPMETMPFPTKAFRDPLTTYWQWLQEQLTLDFGSREALGAALISYSSEGGNSEQDTFPELSRAALMPDLRGAVRSPLGSVSSYNGMLALNGHVSEPLVLPNGYRDQVRRIWRLREQRRFLDGMTTWITQQRVVSNTTSKGATILRPRVLSARRARMPGADDIVQS